MSKDSGKDCKAIIRTHVDDLLAIGPPGKFDTAGIRIEENIEDKQGRSVKILGIELI